MPSFWTGHRWRRISIVEARFRRARGEDVSDGVREAQPAAGRTPLGVTPLETLQVPELTDDELEKLTAPSKE